MDYNKIVDIALKRGFFFPTAEIYNSISGFWDYGPLGVTLKNKLIDLWRQNVVRKNGFIEVDGSVILPESVFKASGHLKNFVDPIVECKKCHAYYRADKLIEEELGIVIRETQLDEIKKYLDKLKCPKCGGKVGDLREFNMMFEVDVGVNKRDRAYLRPETCQNIFLNFPRLFEINRKKLPMGVAQVGKSFRNEISPRRSILRLREFTQAELEIFFVDNPDEVIEFGLKIIKEFFDELGLEYRIRELKEDKPFYSEKSFDLEVKTSLGWLEVVACNYRGDYDLKVHSKGSGKSMEIDGKIPHVFELSMGVDRLLYCMLDKNWVEESGRNVLKIPPKLSPIEVAVFPLVDKFKDKAREVYEMLKNEFIAFYDEKGSIGRRYRRQDEIGTPICVTIDGKTFEDSTVTIRYRDSMEQERIKIDELIKKISEVIK